MSLVTENGSGLPNAESYCSVASADAYHAAMGNDDWLSMTESEKEVALRKATAYMGQFYRESWDGFRSTLDQALDWPRSSVRRRDAPSAYGVRTGFVASYYPNDSVPSIVVAACAMLALTSTTMELLPNLEPAVSAESIGPISVRYADGGSQLTRFTAVDMLLSPVLKSSPGNIRMARG